MTLPDTEKFRFVRFGHCCLPGIINRSTNIYVIWPPAGPHKAAGKNRSGAFQRRRPVWETHRKGWNDCMVFKINYNAVAALLGVLVVTICCIIELALPAVPTDAPAGQQASSEEQLRLPVAMYHHMLTSASRLGDYVISPDQFEADLQYIQKCGYTTVSAAELIDWAENGADLPEKPILITFDDGFESVYQYAYPLLQKYQMKAVVSIIGKHTDLFSDPDEPRNVNWSHLSWDQCREMQQSGLVEIENHTYNMHENTSGKRYGIRIKGGESQKDYREALLGDVGALNEQIKEEIGVFPEVFAYPFGALCKQSRPILEEMGFKIILTCEEKVNVLPSDPEGMLVLRRFNRAHSYSTYQFFQKMGVCPPKNQESAGNK